MSMVQTHQFPMKYDEFSLESMHHRIEENFLSSTPWSYIVIQNYVCRSKEIRRSQCVDSPEKSEKSPRNPSGPIPIPALQPSLSPSHAPVWDGRPPPEPFLCPGRSNPGAFWEWPLIQCKNREKWPLIQLIQWIHLIPLLRKFMI